MLRTLTATFTVVVLATGVTHADRTEFRLTSCEYCPAKGKSQDALKISVAWQNPGSANRSEEENTGHYFVFTKGALATNYPENVIAGLDNSVKLGKLKMTGDHGTHTFRLPLSKLGKAPEPLHLGAAWPYWHTWGDAGKAVPLKLPAPAKQALTKLVAKQNSRPRGLRPAARRMKARGGPSNQPPAFSRR